LRLPNSMGKGWGEGGCSDCIEPKEEKGHLN
jgi:hypothetical protein